MSGKALAPSVKEARVSDLPDAKRPEVLSEGHTKRDLKRKRLQSVCRVVDGSDGRHDANDREERLTANEDNCPVPFSLNTDGVDDKSDD